MRVVRERCGVFAAILERLAQCEVEMIAILGSEVVAGELCTHRVDLCVVEAERLEVCEAPVRLAEMRCQLEAPEIGVDALALAVGGLEHVPVAHPGLGLLRILAQHLGIELDGGREVAEAAQHRCLARAQSRIARLASQQLVDDVESLLRAVLAVQHERVVLPGGGKARSEREATLEQLLGVRKTPEARSHFGEQAQGRDIVWLLPEVLAQQGFGDGDAVLAQRGGGFLQTRIAASKP